MLTISKPHSLRLAATLGAFLLLPLQAFAASALHNTTWRTFDDKTGAAKVLVTFVETNGALTGTITERLAGSTIDKCSKCKGAQKDKPLKGLTIVTGLKPVGSNTFENGSIIDPLTGKTYSLKGTLSADGNTLNLRGYLGVSMLGRNQTWKREP